ncbi:MAG: HAD family hydrolase [Planctomycetota bacterium]|jgi:phosphoglycolate phosphatase
MRKYEHVIWDWNGTLFDDAHVCVEILNTMMGKRNLHLVTINGYREQFGFPVIEYYRKLGFDFDAEDYDDVANEYITLYNSRLSRCKLRDGAMEALAAVKTTGLKQSILSAYHQQMLEQVVEQCGIRDFFTGLSGLNDYYANCKIDLGKKLIEESGLDKDQILLIGDTVHDFEVASRIGCDCVLLTGGHQSEKKLKTCSVPVLRSISEVAKIWS